MKISDKAANLAHEAFDTVADATHQATEAIGKKGERLKHAEQRLMKDCRGYIRVNPIMSLAVTTAVGFVLGHLFSRR